MKISHLIVGLFSLKGAASANPPSSSNLRGAQEDSEQRGLQEISPSSVVDIDPSTTVTVTHMLTTRHHKLRDLCWPGDTAVNAITKYQGKVCDDGFHIIWESMKTVVNENSDEVVIGPHGPCEWSRSPTDNAWNAKFLGSGCGDSPDNMALPRTIHESSVPKYWDLQSHQDPVICGVSNAIYTARYDGTVCPDDHTKVIWNSFYNIDPNGKVMSCHNGLKAVWSRHDWAHDPNFINQFFGHCGVAPTKFPHMRTSAAI